MRDAFGGTFMIQLGLVFLVIYVSFMALALNYAKAFKVKNQIINYIEQYEGVSETTLNKIENYLDIADYYVNFSAGSVDEDTVCYDRGYCITKISSDRGVYYRVQTLFTVEFPLFNLHFDIPVRGETRVITNFWEEDL